MKQWYQFWLPPYGARLEAKVFGMRVTDGVIDLCPRGYETLRGSKSEAVFPSYERRGAIISLIAYER